MAGPDPGEKLGTLGKHVGKKQLPPHGGQVLQGKHMGREGLVGGFGLVYVFAGLVWMCEGKELGFGNDPSAKPQTRTLLGFESKTSVPGSGSQDTSASIW